MAFVGCEKHAERLLKADWTEVLQSVCVAGCGQHRIDADWGEIVGGIHRLFGYLARGLSIVSA